jgi:hypothetical protein
MSVPEKPVQLCEMEDCLERAVASIHAQWTTFDFVVYEACLTHIRAMQRYLMRRRMDGDLALDCWVTYYEFQTERL